MVFGGSFDPIHVGHIALAREVLVRNMADEVWFMVSPMNPLKRDNRITDENIRLQMLRLAVKDEPRFKACDFEFALPRPSYTLHTLNALEKAYPDRIFTLLIGADNWAGFDKWYKGDEILSRFSIVVYPRAGVEKPKLPDGVCWLPSPLYDVSSTMVRSSVSDGLSISGLVPPEVEDFINSNNLYRK